MGNLLFFLGRLLLLLSLCLAPVQADDSTDTLTIGYVELEEDDRYRADSAYAGIAFRTLGRPFPGAQVGVEDARTIGRVTGSEFELRRERAPSTERLTETVREWHLEQNVHFVLADLPAQALLELADASADLPILFFNVSAPDDALRQEECRENIAHTYPSHAMLTDALTQYLVAQNWKDILIIAGETETDRLITGALKHSAKKFGAKIAAERSFSLSNNPRERDSNDIRRLSDDIRYDVVFVADAVGEFARYVPYQTRQPRPVVGSAGLTPHAWHWSWHRHGAPQLQHRFEETAAPRRMNSEAWAAWVAIKALTQAALRVDSTQHSDMRRFLLSDQLKLDSVKGNPTSFRGWDQQLRQPLLLATSDAVIARAPLEEFLHPDDTLDTLGPDKTRKQCQFN